MTWSIVARDTQTGAFGVLCASRALAVGAVVPYGAGRTGVIATQAFANPFFGVDGLRMLQEGYSAQEIVSALAALDEGRDHRQVHLIDRAGRAAAHTGPACIEWSGSVGGPDVSVAGNMLAGPEVVEETLKAYLAAATLDFDERLIVAMEAGERVGGDKRGRQSCAIRIWTEAPFPSFDLRIDDHAEPLNELRRLWRLAHQGYVPFQTALPSRSNPAGFTNRDAVYRMCSDYAEAWNARHPE
ncbi:pilus assembly protein [Bosea sp. Root670]|uniref:DUF1028 domain-containing protein n=1 Tax=unclassified Bosea (in: a-proteobacteria) TaxID=2653178 RepID=UPI000713AB3F|nr:MULTISPECIES: DUF1028 domain-containing protein [unclassified Bosea (in: a-proteobacteria)]KRE08299.1 pilus assembly protein [Bosea sp. Root670]TQI76577.1 putative Ntn-hydrolase superfamily protein [Bosea sp. AK1]